MTVPLHPTRTLVAAGRIRPRPFYAVVSHEPHEGSGDCPVCAWVRSHGSAPCDLTGPSAMPTPTTGA